MVVIPGRAEAIAAGVPVVAGPHMENFAALMGLLRKADGIWQAENPGELPGLLRRALSDRAAARALASRGAEALRRHAGATQRTAGLLALSPGSGES